MFELFSDCFCRDEYLKFERVETKTSNRPDLHAFNLLDRLVPGSEDIVSGAEHDKIYLSIHLSELAKVITEEQITELVRCGVQIDRECWCLTMFA